MTDPDAYRPRVSPEEADRIRVWHERAYAALSARTTDEEVPYLGRTFVVPPDVFPPAPMSELLGRAVLDEVRPSDRVLDMGTGCGVNAVLAASRAVDVTGVDVNPSAVAAARRNAERSGVAERTRFREGDVFERVDGTFDLIVFDPPFRWLAPRDGLEAAIADEGYGALRRFMAEAPARLRPGGRVLLFFGSSGDLAYVLDLVRRSGFAREVLAERALEKEGLTVRYYAYRLTLASGGGARREGM